MPVGCENSVTLLTWEFTGRLATPQWALPRLGECVLRLVQRMGFAAELEHTPRPRPRRYRPAGQGRGRVLTSHTAPRRRGTHDPPVGDRLAGPGAAGSPAHGVTPPARDPWHAQSCRAAPTTRAPAATPDTRTTTAPRPPTSTMKSGTLRVASTPTSQPRDRDRVLAPHTVPDRPSSPPGSRRRS